MKTIACQTYNCAGLRLWSASMVLLLLTSPAVAHAQFTTTTNNGQITISKYTGLGGPLDIPGMIGGLPVTSIGDQAFYDCKSLTNVTIPKSVRGIGTYAFCGCTRLTGVTIPSRVTRIGIFAFYGCTSLTSVTIPKSVTEIGTQAFACTRLKRVLFEGNAPWMGIDVFKYTADDFTINYLKGATGFISPDWNDTSVDINITDSSINRTHLSEYYFPQGKADQFMMGWFADYLSNADEPSLCKLSKKDATANVYRFVFFPPYACVTIFRLEIKPDGSALLELRKVKQLQLQTQMSIVPGRVVRKAEFLVSKRGVNHFLTLLHQMKFWQLPPHVVSKDPILGDDDWLYEAAAFGKYHMVECASSTGPEPILPGEYLMKLIGEWE